MIPESKFRCVKKEFEIGLELEEKMETRMAHGSDEWNRANQHLQYLYELVGAVFQRHPIMMGITVEKALKEMEESRRRTFEMWKRNFGLLEYSVVDAYSWYAEKEGLIVETFTDSQKKQAWAEYLIMKLDESKTSV